MLSIIILVNISIMYVTKITKSLWQLHCNQAFNCDFLSLISIVDSYSFTMMLLQKTSSSRRTIERTFWQAQVSDTFQIIPMNWVIKNSNRKSDDFIKLLTEDQDQQELVT